ncbi:MAG: hypothetical protein Q4Q25_02690, partial [Methanocorpusculum sp.]|nr:hypothetical protein [Methanocorpusculum sp.]
MLTATDANVHLTVRTGDGYKLTLYALGEAVVDGASYVEAAVAKDNRSTSVLTLLNNDGSIKVGNIDAGKVYAVAEGTFNSDSDNTAITAELLTLRATASDINVRGTMKLAIDVKNNLKMDAQGLLYGTVRAGGEINISNPEEYVGTGNSPLELQADGAVSICAKQINIHNDRDLIIDDIVATTSDTEASNTTAVRISANGSITPKENSEWGIPGSVIRAKNVYLDSNTIKTVRYKRTDGKTAIRTVFGVFGTDENPLAIELYEGGKIYLTRSAESWMDPENDVVMAIIDLQNPLDKRAQFPIEFSQTIDKYDSILWFQAPGVDEEGEHYENIYMAYGQDVTLDTKDIGSVSDAEYVVIHADMANDSRLTVNADRDVTLTNDGNHPFLGSINLLNNLLRIGVISQAGSIGTEDEYFTVSSMEGFEDLVKSVILTLISENNDVYVASDIPGAYFRLDAEDVYFGSTEASVATASTVYAEDIGTDKRAANLHFAEGTEVVFGAYDAEGKDVTLNDQNVSFGDENQRFYINADTLTMETKDAHIELLSTTSIAYVSTDTADILGRGAIFAGNGRNGINLNANHITVKANGDIGASAKPLVYKTSSRDEKFESVNGKVYVLRYVEPSHGGGGGSSRRPVRGSWHQDTIGWWFTYEGSNTYPIDKWEYLEYAGKNFWYHFDAVGYMQTGWFKNSYGDWYLLCTVDGDWLGHMLTGWQFVNGFWYYLNPVVGNYEGAMLTGWQLIEGRWYYFETREGIAGRPQGSLYTNCYTPDGYYVNANGVWVL